MQTLVVPSTSPCVDDETLFALARGDISGARLSDAEEHLQHCADCRAVLAEAARGLDTVPPEAGETPLAHIARYRVDALIGAGASGVVYRGFDPQLRRPVALKLLHPAEPGAGAERPERLLREAQAMARLSSPYVVAVYDTGIHEGRVYLVMEFVDGTTLTDWLARGIKSRAEILRVFADAARGLSAAHESGLVHRDFKPANVLVARDDRARVTDFGLARDSEAWPAAGLDDDQASTELYAPTRGLVGTPAYMAPELFENRPASVASDQFAFAVALFVALFDLHPFKAGEGIGLSELIARTHAEAIQRPPLGDATSQRVFEAVKRGLAADPTNRYPSVQHLMVAVERAAGAQRWRRSLAVAAACAAIATATFLYVRAGATPSTPVASDALPRQAASVTVPAATAPSAGLAPLLSASAASPAPALSASANAPARRRVPKPSDVRYKDWLKDPF